MIQSGACRPGVILALLLSTSPLLAQNPDTVARTDSARVGMLPAVVITGTLSGTARERVGVARTMIGRAELEAEPSQPAVDPLRRAPGVHVDEANGPLGPTITRLRGGEETFTQILVDGVQANENGGFFDWQGLTLVNVDRIEVARGPQSAVYGSSAMSGVVQIVSRAGEPGPFRLDGMLEGAGRTSYGGGTRGIVEATGGSQRLRYAAGIGSAYDRGPYRVAHDLRSNDVSLRLDFVPRAPAQLTLVTRFMGIDSKLPVRDPGATRVPLDPNQRNSRDRIITALHGSWSPSDRWTHRVTLANYNQDFTYIDERDGLEASERPYFVFDANIHFRARVDRWTARYVGSIAGLPARGVSATLSYGGQWEQEALETSVSGDFGDASQSVSRPSVAGFVEAHARIGERLSVLAGSRVERFRGLDAAVVPRASVMFDVVPRVLSVRFAAAGAYKAPNVQDQYPNNPFIVGNPDLSPETSVSWEVGADVSIGRATGSVTAFSQSYDNLIRSVPYDESGTQINRNLGRSRASGVEGELLFRPRPRLSFGTSGSWVTTRIVDNRGLPSDQFPTGEELPFRPDYTATAFVELSATRAFTVLMRVSAIGRQTVLAERFSGPRVSIDPYTVVGATGTYRLAPALEAYVYAQNALDRRYETAFDKPGPPRLVALGLRLRRQR